MSESEQVVIVAGFRTPIGVFNGSLASFKGDELGTVVLKHIIEITKTTPDDIIIGQALTAAQGQNPARQTALNAGCSNKVTATTVNMLCGSGLKAIALAYQTIRCGDAKVVVAGGQESMSRAPHCLHLRNGHKMNDATMIDSMIKDGLTDAFHNLHMGFTAEHVAKVFGISREEQDRFALASQSKYKKAAENQSFKDEIVPIKLVVRKEEKLILTDEYPKPETSLDGLGKLKPCFQSDTHDGTVTAGNASGINDGAALVMLTTVDEARQRQLNPLARIVSWHQCGCEPLLMGVAPIKAIQECVHKAGWSLDQIDLFEINEAFASQSVAILKELKLDESKVNVNGGSIALGHPIGASGARVLVTLLHEMLRTRKRRGLAALCIGGGMSIAMAIELV